MGSTRAFGILEVALYREGVGVFEMRGVEICGPGVLWVVSPSLYEKQSGENHHIECSSGGNDGIFVGDVLDTCSWQADRDDGVESKDFSDKGSDVGYFLFYETALPGIAVGVDFHYLFVRTLLNFLSLRR